MSRSAESTIVRDSMSALEYHEAAWEAHDIEAAPPDPSTLSDRALRAILHYQTEQIPAEARAVVQAERRRRSRPIDDGDTVVGLGALAMLAISAVIVAWFLFLT